jgi:hypothetical protein
MFSAKFRFLPHSPENPQYCIYPLHQDYMSRYDLYRSARNGNSDTVQILLEPFLSRASEIECTSGLMGALYISSDKGHIDTVQIILEPFLSRASEIERTDGLQDAIHASVANDSIIFNSLFERAILSLSPTALEKGSDDNSHNFKNKSG